MRGCLIYQGDSLGGGMWEEGKVEKEGVVVEVGGGDIFPYWEVLRWFLGFN